jgi:hypothetical protein
MSAIQSNLSSGQYGYDVVMATSQASINTALMRSYIQEGVPNKSLPIIDKLPIRFTVNNPPMITMYYGLNDAGGHYQMDEATVLSQTNNTDPFTVPAWDGNSVMPEVVANLNSPDSYFAFGFRAQLGLPNTDLSALPNIIVLDPHGQSVTYNMMCASFQVVECIFGREGMVRYLNCSQSPDDPWIFTSSVPLAKLNDATGLPLAVQNQINQLSGSFSVQKLLLDVDNASLESIPAMSGIPPNSDLYDSLNKDFLDEYFKSIKTNGQQVLNYTITIPGADPSTLKITDVAMYADAFIDSNGAPVSPPNPDQQNLSTLNYLCSTAGKTMPTPAQFSWNWLDNDTDMSQYDGVIAINRDTFVSYFETLLTPFIAHNCYLSHVTVSGVKPDYNWSLTSGQTPNILKIGSTANNAGSGIDGIVAMIGKAEAAATGALVTGTVLTYSYNSTSSDQAGLNGDIGKMTLSPSIVATVAFSGNSIIITQHLVVYLYMNHLSSGAGGNVIDKIITDVYDIQVSGDGQLLFVKDTVKSQSIDDSKSPSVNGFLNFFNNVNDLISDIQNWMDAFVPTNFTDIPVSAIQNFVFPGGNTFSFKEVIFSDNLDLIAYIKYNI